MDEQTRIPIVHNPSGQPPAQPYGDVTKLNTCRLVLNSVGKEVLADIMGDYLDLLQTSAAVYEKNGDYAQGLFTSGWCRKMDATSRRLCGTDDNQAALQSGKWHCHESCWQTSNASIETGGPADRPCLGGIRIYAVPIVAGSEVVGSINFGYGPPPQDRQKLREIADRYGLSVDELRKEAAGYESRPSHIIEIAKSRLQTAARLIGEIIERKHVEEELRRLNDNLEQRVEERTAELQRMVNLMAGREVRMAELKDVLGRLRAQVKSAGLTPVADDPLGAVEEK